MKRNSSSLTLQRPDNYYPFLRRCTRCDPRLPLTGGGGSFYNEATTFQNSKSSPTPPFSLHLITSAFIERGFRGARSGITYDGPILEVG